MKSLLLLSTLLVASGAFAFPGPSSFAKAELLAIASSEDLPVVGTMISLTKTKGGAFGGLSTFVLRSVSVRDGELCVTIDMKSAMAEASETARSTDGVVVTDLNISKLQPCSE